MNTKWLVIVLCSLGLSACADDGEVRDGCQDHGGVRSVSGNIARKYVTCIDGYFRTVR